MIRKFLLATAAMGGLVAGATAANAAPVYIGVYQDDVSGSITTIAGPGNGSASVSNYIYGNAAYDSGFGVYYDIVSAGAQGTPPNPEPDLMSNTIDLVGEHPGDGTITLYASELNQYGSAFSGSNSFQSLLGVTSIPTGVSLTESTYIYSCGSSACGNSAIYNTSAAAELLSATTFTSTGSVTDFTPISQLSISSTDFYSVTEVYSFTGFGSNGNTEYTDIDAAIDISAVPEPTSLALLGAGMLGLGMIGLRRKSK